MSSVLKRIDRHMKSLCEQLEGQTALRKGITNFFVEGNVEFFINDPVKEWKIQVGPT